MIDAATVDAQVSYPNEWIATAISENYDRACQQLIYKHGCRELRTGRVDLDVTLDEHGSVASVRTRSVKITRDPDVVERCLLRALPRWRFHPPEHYPRELILSVSFADRC